MIVKTEAASKSEDLSKLASDIKAAHEMCVAAMNRGLDYAREIGEKLVRVKRLVSHGEFTGWIERECGFTARTGRTYMKIATNWAAIEAAKAERGSVLTITEARSLLAEPKPDRRELRAGHKLTIAFRRRQVLFEAIPADDDGTYWWCSAYKLDEGDHGVHDHLKRPCHADGLPQVIDVLCGDLYAAAYPEDGPPQADWSWEPCASHRGPHPPEFEHRERSGGMAEEAARLTRAVLDEFSARIDAPDVTLDELQEIIACASSLQNLWAARRLRVQRELGRLLTEIAAGEVSQ